MSQRWRICIFAHSWRSDWNHGNAHFLRGLASVLAAGGHEVLCYEPEESWSLRNLQAEGERGRSAIVEFETSFAGLDVRRYSEHRLSALEEELRGADVVLVHEWNAPSVVNHILELKLKLGFRALFHDTHHRAYTNPAEILEMGLARFDGVLAFGDALKRIYRDVFGMKRVWTFHEAADVGHFYPKAAALVDGVVWIGNWGDDERTGELEDFLIRPISRLRCQASVYGVRYPKNAQERLREAGIRYGGYLPNLAAARVYGESMLSLHIPRRFYSNGLSGVPTIRVFEALACGIPLICSPWSDTEGLFHAGQDYLIAKDGDAMRDTVGWLMNDAHARCQLAEQGLATIRARHTCEHRAKQFIDIVEELER
jgi:spore maturation protein CgeB